MTRLRLTDGKPEFSGCGRGVRVEDAGGVPGWADARDLPADMPAEDRALVAQALATTAQEAPVTPVSEEYGAPPLLSLTTPVPGVPVPAAPHPETSPAPAPPVEVPVAAAELAEALRQADGRRSGGRPPRPGPSPEAEAATIELTRAKAAVERAKADALRVEAAARIERERELHEARLRREEDAADREAEREADRRRDRPQAAAPSADDLAQRARDARLQAQIERDRLEADVARTTRKDYKVQRRREMEAQPPSGMNTMVLGCSGWVIGAGAGALLACISGAGMGGSAAVGIGLLLVMPWVGAFLLPQVEWIPYRAKVRREREQEEAQARARRREEYLAARSAQAATTEGGE